MQAPSYPLFVVLQQVSVWGRGRGATVPQNLHMLDPALSMPCMRTYLVLNVHTRNQDISQMLLLSVQLWTARRDMSERVSFKWNTVTTTQWLKQTRTLSDKLFRVKAKLFNLQKMAGTQMVV